MIRYKVHHICKSVICKMNYPDGKILTIAKTVNSPHQEIPLTILNIDAEIFIECLVPLTNEELNEIISRHEATVKKEIYDSSNID